MNKQEFLKKLEIKLSRLPEKELKERLDFYSEIIDDRIEEGISEDEAVSEIGSVEDIASQIISDIPLKKIAKQKIKRTRNLRVWEIVLLILGSPIWLSLLIAVLSVVLSLYAVIWSLVASLWAIFASLIAVSIVGIASIVLFSYIGNPFWGLALLGFGLVCAGLSIFMFFGCIAATKGVVILTKKIPMWIKLCFIEKEEK